MIAFLQVGFAILGASLLLGSPALAGPSRLPSGKGVAMNLAQLVPESLGEWRSAEDAQYDRETIFHYMDGAGEVYLSFAFRRLFVRRFAKPAQREVTIELYDMGNASDAFGIFCRNRQGEDAGVGQGSEYRSGYMVFWKGRYFATVFAARETKDSRRVVFELARAVADEIQEEGTLPGIVSFLPQEDLLKRSIRYFHKHTDLNQHYFISDDNILALGPETEAVIANYPRRDEYVYLLLVGYRDASAAEAAFSSYIEDFMPEGRQTGIAQIEDGYWAAAARAGLYLIAVFDAPSARRAGELLEAARGRIVESAR